MKKIDKKELTLGAANLSCADLVGKQILIIGNVGQKGAYFLAKAQKDVILARFAPIIYNGAINYRADIDESFVRQICAEHGAVAMIKSDVGGIEGSLFDIGNAFSVGMDIDVKAIPIRQETIEICNLLDVNPYRLYTDSYVVITDRAKELIKVFMENDILCKSVGCITKGLDKVFINGEERGFINPSRGKDEIYKYIPKGELL